MYYSETLWALKFELYIIFTCHEFFFKLKKIIKENCDSQTTGAQGR